MKYDPGSQIADHDVSEAVIQRAEKPLPYSLLPTPYSLLLTPYSLLRGHPGLIVSLAVYLGLALCYFFIVPIFEAPDEWTHTGHIKYIAEGNGLPVMLPGQGIWGGQQPPLYYAVGALLVQPFELESFDDYLKERANPHASLGYALDPGNKNNFLHPPTETFPYQGLTLTVHILRLYSMFYGLVALIFIYLTAFELFNSRFTIHNSQFRTKGPLWKTINHKSFATFVTLFVACQPMYAFITSSVANEPANMAFCAVGLWLAQRYVLYGPAPHWGRAVALGLVLGLISLSKMTGLSFGLVAVVAFLITSIATRKKPGMALLLWRDGCIIALLTLAVGGWWYWRNYQLYGDFFQRGLYKLYFNTEQQSVTLSEFLYTLSTGEVSFWATFGWLNIVAPDWVYSIYRIISRIGLLGIVIVVALHLGRWKRGRTEERKNGTGEEWEISSSLPPLLLHLVFPVALAFSLTRLVAIEGGVQGRQLLPALGSIAIVIIWGWWAVSPARLRSGILTALIAVMFGLAVWMPFAILMPEYVPKPLLTEAGLPTDLNRLDLTYRNEMKLVGIKLGADMVHPGERVPVTAYWQALKPMTTNYSVFVHFNGRGYQNVGQFNTYPGLGLRPTRTLQPGQVVADTYPVLVEGGSAAPTRLFVNIGLFDFNEPGRPGIEAIGPDGRPTPSTVGQLKLIPARWPAYDNTPPLAEFADNIWLTDYAIIGCQFKSHTCEITFTWLARGQPSADYTVFIQLWQQGEKMAGFDAPPLTGDYPTSLWASGEVILDPHDLDLSTIPAGEYLILAGLYDLTTGDRLPASVGETLLPDYAVNLGFIHLE